MSGGLATPTIAEQASGPRPRASRVVGAVLFTLVVVVMPLATTTIAVARNDELSVYDEYAHIDYLRRVERGEVPRVGDKVLPETARDVACRTISGRRVADCLADVVPPEAIDAGGYSYEAQQPPLYYAITAVIRQPFTLVVNDFVNAARLTGMVWLSAGLAVLWWFLRACRGAAVVPTAIVCALAGLAPPVVSQASTVTNDAAAILIGALVLVGWDRSRRDQRLSTVLLLCAGAVVLVLIKPLAVIPIGAATLGVLIERWTDSRTLTARLRWAAPAIVAAITYQGWQLVRDARAVVPYAEVVEALLGARAILPEFPYHALGVYSSKLLTAYENGGPNYVAGVAASVGLLCVYTPAIATALGHGKRELQALEIGAVAVAVVAPMLLLAQSYFQVHRGGGASARYSLALIPFFLVAFAPWLEAKGVRRLAAAATLVLLYVTMLDLLTRDF
ncbi:MAG: ArnT family glycosyltransferase [Acidimicrobiales bacterium]